MPEMRKEKMLATILASVAGASAASVLAMMGIHDKMFPRHERPDYSLTPGLYDYNRIKDSLPRELLDIPSGSVTLRGYLYGLGGARALLVFCHGFHAGGDEYLPIYEFFVKQGFAVLSYDVRGTYDSEGSGTVGMCQSFVDADRVLEFVRREKRLSCLPLFIMGHSWGGYAAGASLSLHPEIRGAALIAPMNSGVDIMLEKSEQYAGKVALTQRPLIVAYQRALFGDYVKHSAVGGINATKAPVLVAHGVDDGVLLYDRQSVISRQNEIINPRVTFVTTKGFFGTHTSLWHSLRSIAYMKEIESELKLLAMKKGAELTDDERRAFYKTVDHRLFSEVNEQLMHQILHIFEGELKV